MARHLQVLSLVVVVVDREVDNKAEVEHSRDPTSGAKGNALAEFLRCASICLMDNFFGNPRLMANVHRTVLPNRRKPLQVCLIFFTTQLIFDTS